jgi:transcriptional regulator with XRE-family HTH domain
LGIIVGMSEFERSFATQACSELAKRGMSPADLARHTRIPITVLKRILAGKQPPTLRQFAAIAGELATDMREHISDELRQELPGRMSNRPNAIEQ